MYILNLPTPSVGQPDLLESESPRKKGRHSRYINGEEGKVAVTRYIDGEEEKVVESQDT